MYSKHNRMSTTKIKINPALTRYYRLRYTWLPTSTRKFCLWKLVNAAVSPITGDTTIYYIRHAAVIMYVIKNFNFMFYEAWSRVLLIVYIYII